MSAASIPPAPGPPVTPPRVVGLGASAGGLEPLVQFLTKVPSGSGLACLVVQHLDPTHRALLGELLQRATTMPVHEARDRQRIDVDALALLHELQVHQVERELQAEELQASRVALEAALRQRIERQDALPVACLGMDAQAVLQDLNQAAARLLDVSARAALGRSVESCLAPNGAAALRQRVSRMAAGAAQASAAVQLRPLDGQQRWASAVLGVDATGHGFLLVLTATDPVTAPAGSAR